MLNLFNGSQFLLQKYKFIALLVKIQTLNYLKVIFNLLIFN